MAANRTPWQTIVTGTFGLAGFLTRAGMGLVAMRSGVQCFDLGYGQWWSAGGWFVIAQFWSGDVTKPSGNGTVCRQLESLGALSLGTLDGRWSYHPVWTVANCASMEQ